MSNIISFFTNNVVNDRTGIVNNKRRVRDRELNQVNAIVLHQTGFSRGNNLSKYDKIGVHFVVVPNGTVIQLYHETVLLHASCGFNARSVAVEFVGNFPSQRGRWWRGAHANHIPTKQQVIGGRALIAYLQATIGISHVFAHRQASPPNRRGNCPGPHIWYNVGEWGKKRGLSDGGEGFTLRNGAATPAKWRSNEFDLIGH